MRIDRPRRPGAYDRRVRFVLAVVLSVAVLCGPGCSQGEDEGIPAGCREGASALREALRKAPGRVTLGGTPLSECIEDTSGGGELQDVGQAYTYVAARLADAAAEDPDGPSALQLGYLIGALRRGSAGAQNVGQELARRVRAEVSRVDTRSPAFRRGERAGRAHG